MSTPASESPNRLPLRWAVILLIAALAGAAVVILSGQLWLGVPSFLGACGILNGLI